MTSHNSQAPSDYNGGADHVKSRVHKAITSDNYHNHRKWLKSFNTVVYGIVYYRNLIEDDRERLVKRGRQKVGGESPGWFAGRCVTVIYPSFQPMSHKRPLHA